jgi:hypothetical protein
MRAIRQHVRQKPSQVAIATNNALDHAKRNFAGLIIWVRPRVSRIGRTVRPGLNSTTLTGFVVLGLLWWYGATTIASSSPNSPAFSYVFLVGTSFKFWGLVAGGVLIHQGGFNRPALKRLSQVAQYIDSVAIKEAALPDVSRLELTCMFLALAAGCMIGGLAGEHLGLPGAVVLGAVVVVMGLSGGSSMADRLLLGSLMSLFPVLTILTRAPVFSGALNAAVCAHLANAYFFRGRGEKHQSANKSSSRMASTFRELRELAARVHEAAYPGRDRQLYQVLVIGAIMFALIMAEPIVGLLPANDRLARGYPMVYQYLLAKNAVVAFVLYATVTFTQMGVVWASAMRGKGQSNSVFGEFRETGQALLLAVLPLLLCGPFFLMLRVLLALSDGPFVYKQEFVAFLSYVCFPLAFTRACSVGLTILLYAFMRPEQPSGEPARVA